MHFTKKNALNHFFLLNFYMHFSLNIFRTKCINYNTCIIVPCFDYLIFSYKSQKELLTGILKNAYPKKYRICCLQNAYWLFAAKSWENTFHLLIRYWWNPTKARKSLNFFCPVNYRIQILCSVIKGRWKYHEKSIFFHGKVLLT